MYCVDDDRVIDYKIGSDERTGTASDAYDPADARFLYEPNASIMKAGCFALIEHRFGVHQIAPNSHLFTSIKPWRVSGPAHSPSTRYAQ